MEETLKLILEKLGKLEEKTNKIEEKTNKIDKIESDISALKADNKLINSKLDSLTEITYTIMENQTEHKIRIGRLENRAV